MKISSSYDNPNNINGKLNPEAVAGLVLVCLLLIPLLFPTVSGTSYFNLTVSPTGATTSPGTQLTATVAATATLGPTASLQLSITDVPACMGITFSPTSGQPPFTSLMTVTVGASCSAGAYSLTIWGSSQASPLQPNTSFGITVQGNPPVLTPPTLSLWNPSYSPGPSPGLTKMDLNGVARTTTAGATITKINFDPGTGAGPQQGWFPFSWNYPNTQSATYTVTVTATDSNGLQGSATTTIKINASPLPLSITTTSLPNAEFRGSYSAQLVATGGMTPYSWAPTTAFDQSQLSSVGLGLSSSGLLNGVPSNVGPVNFSVTVTDAGGSKASQVMTITITFGPQLVCPTTIGFTIYGDCALPNASRGISYSLDLQGSGGSPPYTYALGSSCCPLPSGLSLTSNGAVSGTTQTPGAFPFETKITDSLGVTTSMWFSITVPPVITCVTTNTNPTTSCANNGAIEYPTFSSTNGGVTINIMGVGLSTATSVSFGTASNGCTLSCIVSDSELKLTTPGTTQTGIVNVAVTTSNAAQSGSYCFLDTVPGSAGCTQLVYLPDNLQTCGSLTTSLSTSLSATFASGSSTLTTSGSASLSGTDTVCISSSNFSLQHFGYTHTITTSVSLTASSSSGFTFDNTAKPQSLGGTRTLGTIDVGPVVIVINARPYMVVQSSLTAATTLGASETSTFGYGFSYTPSGGWQTQIIPFTCLNAGGDPNNLCFVNNGSVTLSGSLTVKFQLAIQLLFYDVAGPVVTPSAWLRADAGYAPTGTTTGPTCGSTQAGLISSYSDLCAGISAAFSGQLAPIGFTVAKTNPIQFDLGSVLLAASVSISPSAATLSTGQTQVFASTVAGSPGAAHWSTSCGSLDQTFGILVTFTAPAAGETCTITATTALAYPTTATAPVTVQGSSLPNVVISTPTTLTADLRCATLIISPGIVLTTNGYGIYCTGAVTNEGIITTGASATQDYPLSYGASSGGGESAVCNAAASAGYSTLASGGHGSNSGNAQDGATPTIPTITDSLISSWYANGITNYLSGSAGQTVCAVKGGLGANGLIIEGYSISPGTVNAAGQNGVRLAGTGLSGAGGGGVIVLVYGAGGLQGGTSNVNVSGGKGVYSVNGTVRSGNGGAGSIVTLGYGTGNAPIPP